MSVSIFSTTEIVAICAGVCLGIGITALVMLAIWIESQNRKDIK